MRKINVSLLFKCTLGLVFLLGSPKTKAQLAAGDILFTGFDSQPGVSTTGPRFDRVSFVALKTIPVNTVIYFTDRGYKANTWYPANANTEGTVKLTVTTKISAGKEVSLILTPENNSTNYYAATLDGASIGTLVQQTSRLSLSNSGDQLFAFQGGSGDPGGNGAVLIAGLHWNASQTGSSGNYTMLTTDAGWDNLGSLVLGPNNSDLPPTLVAGQSAFWLGSLVMDPSGYNYNVESAAFNGADKPYTTASQIRTALLKRSNWVRYAFGTTNTEVTVPTNHFTTVLPVTLTQFTANLNKLGILKVDWKTAQEKNNSHFIVESSRDGKFWRYLIRKDALPNSTAGATYQVEINMSTLGLAGFTLLGLLLLPFSKKRYRWFAFLAVLAVLATSCAKNNEANQIDLQADQQSGDGNVLYLRLAQVDKDGTTTYSQTIFVKAQ
ncbi:hypothetical protein [Pedobacter sp. ASV28]|uniref:hypothetical protein n=1 Tax=Pedobacter sp. ASV28 TaxID=2795123 RepID=UPI0018EBF9F0|nr:hypothetical protein [Pedobacter sp. ASV28]